MHAFSSPDGNVLAGTRSRARAALLPLRFAFSLSAGSGERRCQQRQTKAAFLRRRESLIGRRHGLRVHEKERGGGGGGGGISGGEPESKPGCGGSAHFGQSGGTNGRRERRSWCRFGRGERGQSARKLGELGA